MDHELYELAKELFELYGKIRDLQKHSEEVRGRIQDKVGDDDMIVSGEGGDLLIKHIHRIEDYIRGANATALKNEDPETFAKYGGKTSESNTLRVYATNE